MIDTNDLAKPGTGERARQFGDLPEFAAKALDVRRSEACEAQLQAEVVYSGCRFSQMVPPFLKWPIWQARPQRPRREPKSLLQLDKGLTVESRQVRQETYSLGTLPRVGLTIAYLCGELGALDRRHLIGLVNHAKAVGPDDDRGRYRSTAAALAKVLDTGFNNPFRERLASSLWRMSGTPIRLTEGDPLAKRWTSRSFHLLPSVEVERRGREQHILYTLPDDAVRFIESGKLVTVDMQALRGMDSAAAESLYLLLYDLAQWYNGKSVLFAVADLAVRLGLRVYEAAGRAKKYDDWSKVRRYINGACERVWKYGGFLRDWTVEGRGAQTVYGFHFADKGCRLHLPPARA